MLWFTGDQHFGHANIIRYCQRPFLDVAEMDATIITRFRAKVRPGDTVINVGDFAFVGSGGKAKAAERVRKLADQMPCKQRSIVPGNHDDARVFELSGAFKDIFVSGKPWPSLTMFVYEDHATRWCLRVQHEPVPWPFRKQTARRCDLVIHGHSHSRGGGVNLLAPTLVSIDVGVDAWNFFPVSADDLIAHAKRAIAAGRIS